MAQARELDCISPGSAESLPPASEDLDRVLERLERSLQVDLIATYQPRTCTAIDRSLKVLQTPELASFDQFPVREGDRVIGVLERGQQRQDCSVRDVMRSLDDAILIAASTGILSYIKLATASSYHLVVYENRICGIVTPSDLLKLPVRILLFTVITHLESIMASSIQRSLPDDSWLIHLSPGRQDKLDETYEELLAERRDPDRLQLTQLCDKREILATGLLESNQRDDFKRDLQLLEDLRNDVMHSKNYVPNAGRLSDLVDKATNWIRELAQMFLS